MKPSRIVLRWAAVLISAWLVITVAAGLIAAEIALHPGRNPLAPGAQLLAQSIALRNHAQVQEVSIPATDAITLRAWFIRPLQSNGDAVILLHGVSDNRAGMLGNANLLLRHGYAVLLPDARAHGASSGDLATYGVKEADDIRRWFNWIQETEASHCIDGLGESMGAGELLNSLSAEPGFCAVVAESPFASFREASYDRLGQQLHEGSVLGRTLLRPAVTSGFLYAQLRYGVDLNQSSPETAVAASHVPVLLIHGKKDSNLPDRHSEMILARSASRGSSVVLWEPANAEHCGASQSDPQEYQRRVLAWFADHRPIN
jgi:dipeptidyl aminopeptidase/acylaminoacyl peptidase